MEFFLSQVQMILPVLGHQFLNPRPMISTSEKSTESTSPVFECHVAGADANAVLMDDEFVVLKGSTARKQELIPGPRIENFASNWLPMRSSLIAMTLSIWFSSKTYPLAVQALQRPSSPDEIATVGCDGSFRTAGLMQIGKMRGSTIDNRQRPKKTQRS